eukprot:jgi/Psemu1/318400/estExt_fgenesh1_pm.C_720002
MDQSQPILTVPRDLSFDTPAGNNTSDSDRNRDGDTTTSTAAAPCCSGYGIYLNEDWDSGIGGGLWTTGKALSMYCAKSPHFLQQFRRLQLRNNKERNRPVVRVLELGSGNGFLGVCLVTAVAVAAANASRDDDDDDDEEPRLDPNSNSNWPGIEVVVTDTAEHMQLMKATIQSNLERILPQILHDRQHRRTTAAAGKETIRDGESSGDDAAPHSLDIERIASVQEYLWGESYNFGGGDSSSSSSEPFDLILGSDVAYRDYLHDPLIAALKEFSRPPPNPTVALIGVTMNDTKPIFFEKLHAEGFCYEKLADHLFDKEFSTCSRQFGIFAISRR